MSKAVVREGHKSMGKPRRYDLETLKTAVCDGFEPVNRRERRAIAAAKRKASGAPEIVTGCAGSIRERA